MNPRNAPAIAEEESGLVLIVDDTPENLTLLRAILEGRGFRVAVANSGERALKNAGRLSPDLILLDVMMPGMDGYETCRRLKAEQATREIPVIFVTAKTDLADVVEGFACGGVDYIAKPYRTEEVSARVDTHVRMRLLQRERQRLLDRQRAQAEYLHAVMETIADGIITLDAEGAIQSVNPAVGRLFGHAPSALAGRPVASLLDDAPAGEVLREAFGEDAPLDSRSHEMLGLREDGSTFPVDVALSRIDASPARYVAVVHDITLHKQVQEELKRLSGVDALTDVANRRRFDQVMAKELARAQREGASLALALIDVDYFKRYNDRYGHQQGDRCLQQVARALEEAARRPVDLVARYGGEEFVVVLPGLEREGAEAVGERIRSNVESLAIEHAGSEASAVVTVSVGVTVVAATPESSAKAVIEEADRALYEAKGRGRNQVVAYDGG